MSLIYSWFMSEWMSSIPLHICTYTLCCKDVMLFICTMYWWRDVTSDKNGVNESANNNGNKNGNGNVNKNGMKGEREIIGTVIIKWML